MTRSAQRFASAKHLIMLAAAFAVAGCAGTYIAEPPLRGLNDFGADDAGSITLSAALAELMRPKDGASIAYALCDAGPKDADCLDPGDNPSGGGVGGLFIPLFLTVPGMEITDSRSNDDGETTYDVAFETYVNGIPPICDDSEATIVQNANGSATIKFSNFYCNWLAIGNVISQFELSVDKVDQEMQRFSGYYKVQFNGTGNAAGSGYYIAYRE